jgi:hypothetical protein
MILRWLREFTCMHNYEHLVTEMIYDNVKKEDRLLVGKKYHYRCTLCGQHREYRTGPYYEK